MELITPLSALCTNPKFGGKANRLAEMLQNGFHVPEGFVILPETFQLFLDTNPKLSDIIDEIFLQGGEVKRDLLENEFAQSFFVETIDQELEKAFVELIEKYKSVVVRSSGSMEDGINSSFAGQFETYLNVLSYSDFRVAVKKCWQSLYSHKVLSYAENQGLQPGSFSMSVVVQAFIDSDVSGVVFTANPLTGNDKQMVIEAVAGLGEGLVQGAANPDSYLYNWYDDEIEVVSFGLQKLKVGSKIDGGVEQTLVHSIPRLLNNDQLLALGTICLDIQQFYGEPLDIEWAIKSDKLFILQARPLTSIHFKVEYEWTTADLKDGGISSSVTTPMMYSLYEFIFERTMPSYFKSIKILPKQKFNKWFNWWFGFSYWNMLAAKEGVKQIPGFVERNFDLSLGIEPDYQGNGHITAFSPKTILKGIQILLATNKSISKRSDVCKKDIESAKKYFDECEALYLKNPDLPTVTRFFSQMVKERYSHLEGSYFYTIYDNSNAATFFQEALEKANKKRIDKINYLNLVGGLSNLSHMRSTYDLWEISEKIKADEMAFNYFVKLDAVHLEELIINNVEFPFSSEIRLFITKYRYHSLRELDIMIPNWDEDQQQISSLLLDFIKNSNISNPKVSLKKQNAIYKAEKQKLNSKGLKRKLASHRHLLWWREEMRDYSSMMYYHIRRVLLMLGDKMVSSNLINHRDDVFFLKFNQLIDFANTGNKSFKVIIDKNRKFYQSYRNFKNPNEIWQKRDFAPKLSNTKSNNESFIGISGSHGKSRAKAVVIKSIFEAERIEDDCILVTKFTDPAWTIYFARISGLVTETGGMLSHGAVVSREYGIPAVLGVTGVTDKIKTGDIIEINGDTGEVIVVGKIH